MALLSLSLPRSAVHSLPERRHVVMAGLVLGLFAVVLLSLGLGAVRIPVGDAVAVLAEGLGLSAAKSVPDQLRLVLLHIRLPRTLLAALAGAGLAVSGAALQGLFRNPLADPGLIGVSSGAALAAATTIVFGGMLFSGLPPELLPYLLPLGAFGGGLIAVLLAYRLASGHGQTDVATLLLAGVALNAIAGAGIGLLIFASDDQQLRDLNFWMLGSVAGANWSALLPALAFLVLPLLALPFLGRALNALLLGETEAAHLGFRVERAKKFILLLAALATGAAVALCGVIGFVGLVVPHLVRLVAGPDHRFLLPASALLGAALLLLADLLARTLVLPAELPIGIVTSCVGGPFFLWMLLRQRARGGGALC
ncbi:FecCD family ABC transporter permease [Fodinicurvata fenggangensis]|uniref:FecCD family ABC transporter permease n=1 Tax=Fodinicurvata fenggangensis TaxID=1121830 RepID=UPI00054D4144|nr:iron ABC transporter permease [Fodinicurvata fenggangensis]